MAVLKYAVLQPGSSNKSVWHTHGCRSGHEEAAAFCAGQGSARTLTYEYPTNVPGGK